MAHDIAQINGKNSIAYVGETPWHQLGTQVEAGITLDAAFEAASLNWDVTAYPAFATIPVIGGEAGATRQIALETQAIVRDTDGVKLGEVGKKYVPIQHRTAFRIFEPTIASGQLAVEVLGSLGQGETVWLLLKLSQEQAQTIRVGKDGQPDVVLPYVLGQTAHDGSRQFTVKPTTVRVVCRNTLNASGDPRKDAWITIRHTASANDQIEQVRAVLASASERYRKTCDLFRELAAAQINEAELIDFVNEVLPLPAKPKSLLDIALEQAATAANALLAAGDAAALTDADTQALKLAQTPQLVDAKQAAAIKRYNAEVERIEGERATTITLAQIGKGNDGSSLWDAVNGVTEFVDHVARRDTDYARKQNAIRAIAGDGAAIKDAAFALALKRVGKLVAA